MRILLFKEVYQIGVKEKFKKKKLGFKVFKGKWVQVGVEEKLFRISGVKQSVRVVWRFGYFNQ